MKKVKLFNKPQNNMSVNKLIPHLKIMRFLAFVSQ